MKWVYAVLAIIAIIVVSQLLNQTNKKPSKKVENLEDYKGKYEKQFLLTGNEKIKYGIIKAVATKLKLTLFAKVRLADIVKPYNNAKPWKTLFYKVQSKHVDFLLCNEAMKPICVIEIDDASHDREDRKERDKFCNYILNDVGITVLHKRGMIIDSELEEEIKKAIR